MSRTKPASVANRRHSSMKWCEVIRVDSPFFLISSRQHACRYEMADGALLANGYYLALSPAGAGPSSYGREIRYVGPLATKDLALMLQASALWMGVADLEVNGDHVAFHAPPSEHRPPSKPTASLAEEAAGEVLLHQDS